MNSKSQMNSKPKRMMKTGYTYILKCSNGSYYTGSTVNLERRLIEHQNGEGANHTKKYLPVELVYFEKHSHVAEAFRREKQIQGWSRTKKEALINGKNNLLPTLSRANWEYTKTQQLKEK